MKDEFTEAAIGEDAHVTTASLYAEHLRRTKEKAEKKKSVRKSKKKKKKNLPIPMERCEEAEECLSFGHEIIWLIGRMSGW